MGIQAPLCTVPVHVGAILAVMAIVGLLVDEKFGRAVIRKVWLGSHQFWTAAFIVAGIVSRFS
jgi:hypothetical protein